MFAGLQLFITLPNCSQCRCEPCLQGSSCFLPYQAVHYMPAMPAGPKLFLPDPTIHNMLAMSATTQLFTTWPRADRCPAQLPVSNFSLPDPAMISKNGSFQLFPFEQLSPTAYWADASCLPDAGHCGGAPFHHQAHKDPFPARNRAKQQFYSLLGTSKHCFLLFTKILMLTCRTGLGAQSCHPCLCKGPPTWSHQILWNLSLVFTTGKVTFWIGKNIKFWNILPNLGLNICAFPHERGTIFTH